MKKIVLIIVALAYSLNGFTQENEEKTEKEFKFFVDIKQNNVAGFYPVFLGFYPLNENLDLTFYNIFWTNPSFGTLETGSNLLLENGIGLGFKLLDKSLYVNPTFGIATGSFLTQGDDTLLAEGLVPNLLVLYKKGRFEIEAYLGYYLSIREAANGAPSRDFLLNWIIPSVRLNKIISVGPYYEQFVLTHQDNDIGERSIYQWLGAHININLFNNVKFRLAAGVNIDSSSPTSKEFYKVNIFVPLN